MLGDIRNPRWLYVKAAFLLLAGIIAIIVLLVESPTVRTAGLLAIAIYCFCRAYYFAFYVVQHYADPQFKFAGLFAFARYCWSRRRSGR